MSAPFTFKQFVINQDRSSMKVNTDGILLGAWVETDGASEVLDIGTGNGLIALMLAQRCSTAQITGVEIDENAFLDAKENASQCAFKDRIVLVKESIQNYSKSHYQSFDLIVSNPPFFSGGTFSSNENKANVRHTIKLPHGDLLIAVTRLLTKEGKFSVILPYIEGLRFVELANRSGLRLKCKTTVYAREEASPERLLLSFCKGESAIDVNESKLIIHEGDSNTYSSDYIQLTQAFYLNM